MRDDETGSWWQQVTGEAIYGPLKGKQLRSVIHDELTFGLWKREKPNGRVLQPDAAVAQAGKYAPANWEERMTKVPVTTSAAIDNLLDARAIVIGIKVNDAARAYPFDAVLKQSPILDQLGGVPILIVLGDDHKSVRVFDRTVDGRKLEFFVKPDASPLRLVDSDSGSEWDFAGSAIAGSMSGKQLKKLALLNDYWFDWKTYNPKTTIYQLGNR